MDPYTAFEQANNASVTESGVYLPPAAHRYIMRIKKIATITIRAGGAAFVVDLEVVESTNPAIPPGMVINWFQRLNDSAPGELKRFTRALLGRDATAKTTDIDQHIAHYLRTWCDANGGDAIGQLIAVQTKGKITRSGKDFTVCAWEAAQGFVVGAQRPAAPPVGSGGSTPQQPQPAAAAAFGAPPVGSGGSTPQQPQPAAAAFGAPLAPQQPPPAFGAPPAADPPAPQQPSAGPPPNPFAK